MNNIGKAAVGAGGFANNATELNRKIKKEQNKGFVSRFFAKKASIASPIFSSSSVCSSNERSRSGSVSTDGSLSESLLSFKNISQKKLAKRVIVGWTNFCAHIKIKWFQLLLNCNCFLSSCKKRELRSKINALINQIKERQNCLLTDNHFSRAKKNYAEGHIIKGLKSTGQCVKHGIKSIGHRIMQ